MRRYGVWAGNPKGRPENYEHCVAGVWPKEGHAFTSYQCARKRGHGPNDEYCKQHGAKEEERLGRQAEARGRS